MTGPRLVIAGPGANLPPASFAEEKGCKVKIKIIDSRLHDWGLPRYQTPGAAALDLFACLDAPMQILPQAAAVLIGSGLALSFEEMSCAGLVLPRSGLGHRGLVLGNAVGLIDPDYTGEAMISVWNRNRADSQPITIRPGERIAQLLFVPILRPELQIVDDIATGTERAAGGFGSTGR